MSRHAHAVNNIKFASPIVRIDLNTPRGISDGIGDLSLVIRRTCRIAETMATDLKAAREMMRREGIAGWLTRDYRYTNPVFFAALGCEPPNLTPADVALDSD